MWWPPPSGPPRPGGCWTAGRRISSRCRRAGTWPPPPGRHTSASSRALPRATISTPWCWRTTHLPQPHPLTPQERLERAVYLRQSGAIRAVWSEGRKVFSAEALIKERDAVCIPLFLFRQGCPLGSGMGRHTLANCGAPETDAPHLFCIAHAPANCAGSRRASAVSWDTSAVERQQTAQALHADRSPPRPPGCRTGPPW